MSDTTARTTFSVYAMPGRAADAARAPAEAVEAEALGLGTIWLSDRRDMKEGAVLCGAMAQATSDIAIGTSVTHIGTRHPQVLAAIGASMQGLSDERFRFGFGRGMPELYNDELGLTYPTLGAMRDNADILRQLWEGKAVDYHGPLGSFNGLTLGTRHEGKPPELLLAAGGPRMLQIAGESYDGVFLEPSISADTVARFARTARDAAASVGRDPEAFRVVAIVVVAADLPADEEARILGGRLVTYLQTPGFGERVVEINGWDPALLTAIRDHPLFEGRGHEYAYADANFSLTQLAEVAQVLPDHLVRETNAVGSRAEVARRLGEYLAAGADELILHGSSPTQLAALLDDIAPREPSS